MEEVAARNLGQTPGTRQFQIRSRTNPAVSYWGTFHGYGLTAFRHPGFYIKDNLPDYHPYMSFPSYDWTYHAEKVDHMARREAAIKAHERALQLRTGKSVDPSIYWPLYQPRPPAELKGGASRKNRRPQNKTRRRR